MHWRWPVHRIPGPRPEPVDATAAPDSTDDVELAAETGLGLDDVVAGPDDPETPELPAVSDAPADTSDAPDIPAVDLPLDLPPDPGPSPDDAGPCKANGPKCHYSMCTCTTTVQCPAGRTCQPFDLLPYGVSTCQ